MVGYTLYARYLGVHILVVHIGSMNASVGSYFSGGGITYNTCNLPYPLTYQLPQSVSDNLLFFGFSELSKYEGGEDLFNFTMVHGGNWLNNSIYENSTQWMHLSYVVFTSTYTCNSD
jgi:hypothetical protein